MAGKTATGHNSTLCVHLSDQEFKAVMKKKAAGSREEDAYCTEIEDCSTQDELEDLPSEDSDAEHGFMVDVTVDEEIKASIDEGLPVDDVHQVIDLHALTTNHRQTLCCICQVALGQDKTCASCLQDIGSTGTFVTHRSV